MFKHTFHPVIAAGLAALLTFGTAACSFESSSTTEVSTTDENGTTTTETTTTTTDSEGNTTTETETTTTDAEGNKMGKEATTSDAPTASVSFTGYGNEYYKIGFALPDGFSKSNQAYNEPEGVTVDYQASNADGSARVLFCLIKGVTGEEGITDAKSWCKVYTDELLSTLKKDGYANAKAGYGPFDIGGITYGESALIDYNNGAKVGVGYILDEDGDGMIIQIYAPDEATLETIEANFIAMQ